MTTIVATKTGIWADTYLSGGGAGPLNMNKVMRLADGSLLAGAGTVSQLAMLEQALNQAIAGETLASECTVDDLTAVRVLPDGELVYYDHCTVPFTVLDPEFTLGSGADIARTALFLELPYEDAMELAATLDPGTGEDYAFYPLEDSDEHTDGTVRGER